MKFFTRTGLIAAAIFSFAGCYSPDERAVGDAAIGGLASNRSTTGTANGAATGAVAGALTAPPPRQPLARACAQYGWDYYGHDVCVAYY